MSKYVRQEKSQRKHPVASSASSLIKAPFVPAAPKERPGFKGPGFIKKTAKQPARPVQSKSAPPATLQEKYLPLPLQQLLLNVLRTSFPVCLEYETLKAMLQDVRLALEEGDIEKAFSRRDWMEAYVVRWSSIRSLCFSTVLVGIFHDFRDEIWVQSLLKDERELKSVSRAICFGGGPTELLTFAAALRHVLCAPTKAQDSSDNQPQTDGVSQFLSSSGPLMSLHLVDRVDWSPVLSHLKQGLQTPPVLSKYASQSAIMKNTPFVPSDLLNISFLQSTILGSNQDELAAIIGSSPTFITFFFTLNDLHTTSIAKTTALLLKITLAASKDTLLLVIDSPALPSDAAAIVDEAGKERKRFRVGDLLDFAVMGKLVSPGVATKLAWKELVRDDNRLFKFEESLKFPISLDHVKFQMHLFRKL